MGGGSGDGRFSSAIRKYWDEMPPWVLFSVVPFGTFLGVVKYCADRWDDEDLRDRHYRLKRDKSLRNASSHGAYILNDLGSAERGGIAKAIPPRFFNGALGVPLGALR